MTALHGFLPAWGTPLGEAARAAVIGAAFLAILGAVELWRRRLAPPPEWTRKAAHFGCGIVIATFPWAFSTHWTVLVFGAVMLVTFAVAQRVGLLHAITGVERRSSGERWYPVGVYVLFVVARGQPVFWLIALWTLVVSDTAAALLGTAYGRHAFFAARDRKSVEGSAAFFVATFLGVHLPLLLFTGIERGTSVLVALQIALLVTSFEAISLRGNDNLVVPLATYYLLVKMTPKPAESIALQLAAQLAILALTLLVAWRTRALSWAGALAAHLAIYAAFSLGGPAWSVAPVLALASLVVLDRRARRDVGGRHQVEAVFWLSIVGVALIFLDNTFATALPRRPWLRAEHPFVVPYVGALAAPTAIVVFQFLRLRRTAWSRPAAIALAVVAGWLLVAPLGLTAVGHARDGRALAETAAMSLTAVTLYHAGRRVLRRRAEAGDLMLQGAAVAAAALVWTIVHLSASGPVAAPGASHPEPELRRDRAGPRAVPIAAVHGVHGERVTDLGPESRR